MNVLFDIAHPASAHFFKNLIKELNHEGHRIIVLARSKDITLDLLDCFNIKYIKLGKHYKNLIGKILCAFIHILKMVYYGLHYKIDIFIDAGTIYPALVSWLLKKVNIIVDNTDVDFTLNATKIFNPTYITNVSFNRKMSNRHIFIDSFNELAFLHPSYFVPNKNVIRNIGLKENEKLILLRFVLWRSVDDIGLNGYSVDEIREIVRKFSEYGKVLISSEYDLPDDLKHLRIETHPAIHCGQMQDLEYYATLLFGESGAMAAECAMLGTPSIFISPKKLGFIKELYNKYNLVCHFENKTGALENAIRLLEEDNLKEKMRVRRKRMLDEKISYTTFLKWFIINYPTSYKTMIYIPSYQYKFKN